MPKMIEIKQAGIYLANLDPVKVHEQSGCRPILILQNDILNKNLNTVIVAPLTKISLQKVTSLHIL